MRDKRPIKYLSPAKFVSLLMCLYLFCMHGSSLAQSGYGLWLDYKPLSVELSATYRHQLAHLVFPAGGVTDSVAKQELLLSMQKMLGHIPEESIRTPKKTGHQAGGTLLKVKGGTLLVGTADRLSGLIDQKILDGLPRLGEDGYRIIDLSKTGEEPLTAIIANKSTGLLYGTYAFIGLLQQEKQLHGIDISSCPAIRLRLLNHWDNLDRTVERGYAGFSLWDWHRLPGYRDPRYTDYARANASIGINGTVLNNVNTNALIFTPAYLEKVAALADVFRPYGIRVYLSARFSAPMELGGLPNADPLNPAVQQWWKDKVAEIYRLVPDFGGFLVKANSEGQPGPQNYGRNHAEGANLLADALQPHGGIVMWRAFVYEDTDPEDRAKQAYNEFKPLDGQFRDNVIVQVKNGPIDFQPREPFHPLFGAMPQSQLMMEFQITQEYLGFATHLAYLGTLFSEVLREDTYSNGKNTTVARIIDGTAQGQQLTAIAGVANTGTSTNWTGHPFAQANWYAYGQLAWDPDADPARVAESWLKRTFGNKPGFIREVLPLMMRSREAVVRYMTPLGLHHLMGWDHHYGPGPWIRDKMRADWTSVYYHKADTLGIGFNRTASGSNALGQYTPEVQARFRDPQTCPDEYLLWFHHLPWDFRMKSGQTLWDALCHHYYQGVDEVVRMQAIWEAQKEEIDPFIFREVSDLMAIQYQEACLWRDACVLYFQQFSKRPIPEGLPQPARKLEYYESLQFHFVPGI